MGQTLIDDTHATSSLLSSGKTDDFQCLKSEYQHYNARASLTKPIQNVYSNSSSTNIYQINSTNPSSVSSASTSSSSLSSPNSFHYYQNNNNNNIVNYHNYNPAPQLMYNSLNTQNQNIDELPSVKLEIANQKYAFKNSSSPAIVTKRKSSTANDDDEKEGDINKSKLIQKLNSNFSSNSTPIALFDFYDCKSKLLYISTPRLKADAAFLLIRLNFNSSDIV